MPTDDLHPPAKVDTIAPIISLLGLWKYEWNWSNSDETTDPMIPESLHIFLSLVQNWYVEQETLTILIMTHVVAEGRVRCLAVDVRRPVTYQREIYRVT